MGGSDALASLANVKVLADQTNESASYDWADPTNVTNSALVYVEVGNMPHRCHVSRRQLFLLNDNLVIILGTLLLLIGVVESMSSNIPIEALSNVIIHFNFD